jgi:hypothetical protein
LTVGTVNTAGLTGTAAITLTAGGGVTVTNNLSAGGANNVSINAQGGTITGVGMVTANLLTLDAGGAITANTTVSNLNASTSVAGAINVIETDAVVLDDVDTANGLISVTAAGAVTATDVVSLTDNAANTIAITSTGAGIVAGFINAGTLGDVTLNAQGGAITDAAGKITADALVADAVGAMALDTTVNTINASTSAAGAMQITETDDVELVDVDTVSGSLTAAVGGALTATNVQATGGSLSLNAGSMTLGTVGAGGAVNLTAGSTINGGTFSGSSADINAGTIGLTTVPTANVSTLQMTLTSVVGGRSGEVAQGAALTVRPSDANIASVGTVTIGPWIYLSSIVDVDIQAILASMSTLSSSQEQLEALLSATTASEFFMTPPLEIYIDMEEDDEFDDELEENF